MSGLTPAADFTKSMDKKQSAPPIGGPSLVFEEYERMCRMASPRLHLQDLTTCIGLHTQIQQEITSALIGEPQKDMRDELVGEPSTFSNAFREVLLFAASELRRGHVSQTSLAKFAGSVQKAGRHLLNAAKQLEANPAPVLLSDDERRAEVERRSKAQAEELKRIAKLNEDASDVTTVSPNLQVEDIGSHDIQQSVKQYEKDAGAYSNNSSRSGTTFTQEKIGAEPSSVKGSSRPPRQIQSTVSFKDLTLLVMKTLNSARLPKTNLTDTELNTRITVGQIRKILSGMSDHIRGGASVEELMTGLPTETGMKTTLEPIIANFKHHMQMAADANLQREIEERADASRRRGVYESRYHDEPNERGDYLIGRAARNNQMDVLQELVAAGITVNRANISTGSTGLHYAAQQGLRPVASYLIDKGVDVRAQTKDGKTALFFASQEGHNDLVELLIDANADPNVVDDSGKSPLMASTEGGHAATVSLLIFSGGSMDEADGQRNIPLHVAIMRKHKDIALNLVTSSANVDAVDGTGTTALILAAQTRQIDVMEALLLAGADVDAVNKNGQSAMNVAAFRGHTDVLRTLIKNGGNVNNRSKFGTPLQHAITENKSAAITLLKAFSAQA